MAFIYKLRVCLISTVAVILIIMAVAFTVIRAFLPHATDYVAEIQQALSAEVGLSVSIDAIDADMSWFTPRLKLINFVVRDKDGVSEIIRLDEVIFSLAYIDSLFNLSPVVGEINLVGANIRIERHLDNRWVIQGIEFTDDGVAAPSEEMIKLIKNTNFSLLDSDVYFKDYVRKKEAMEFVGVNIILESFLGTHSLAADMQLPSGFGESLRVIASIDGDIEDYQTAQWKFYLEGRTVNVKRWMNEFDVTNTPFVEGTLDGKVWLNIDNSAISRVTSDLSVNNLKLVNEVYGERKWDADYLAFKFDWQQMNQAWRADARDLILVKNNDAWAEVADITAINNDETGLRVTATYLRPFDLLGLAGVFLPTKDMSEIDKMQSILLSGDFYNITLYYPVDKSDALEIDATFSNLDLKLVDSDIELRGADGIVNFEKDQFNLELVSESLVADFGEMFREPIAADFVTGKISGKRENSNWIIESPDISLVNKDIKVNSRVKAVLDKNGGVYVDLQSDFVNAKGVAAHKYYPLPVMSEDLVAWLDKAIVDGNIEKGSFALFGNVNNFPYENNDGVMEIVFSAKDLTLHFYDGWPDIEELTGDVRFYNSSLSIENGTGKTYRGSIKNASASIPDLDAPLLFVSGKVTGPSEDIQKYIWNSGLDDSLGDAMRQFQMKGMLGLDLSLEIPLDGGDEANVKVKSELTLSDNEIYFPAMEYLFSGLNGKLFFTENTIEGSNLVASFEGSPIKIDAYSQHEKSKLENIFHLTGNFPINGLVKRLEMIPNYWLKGSSDWDVIVRIPDKVENYLIKVEMQSALEGVEIDVTDLLRKSANDALHLEVGVKILHDSIDLDVNSDGVVSLFATRDERANWNFVVDSDLIRGSGDFAEDFNKDSVMEMSLENLNLRALTYSSKTSSAVSLDPAIFPSLNVSTKILVWDDWSFNNVSLETSPDTDGMLIKKISLEGPSVKVSGHGSWLNKWNNTDETTLEATIKSSDIGNMLSAMEINNSISRGEGVLTVNWLWPAEPYNVSMSTIKGTSHIELKNGEITNLKPGAGGRLLGLLNAFKLADRLALDFGDVYKKGFKFDSIVGDYSYDMSQIYTDGIEIGSAAADMKLLGRIGLMDRDYDMVMQVKPHTSEAVFTSFALMGGLVTGAAAVLANKVFGLEKLAHDTYSVTGSWDDPVVELIAKSKIDDTK